jgi:hypothetical protein
MTEEKPRVTPEQAARQAARGRIVLGICAVFFALFAVALGAYAVNQHQDWAVRTSPPGGHTTTVPIDEVTTGQNCSTNGKTTNCSPEYTLTYVVDGDRHSTAIRKHLHPGDRVHAFKGSNGHWYVTEDPGFGNSRVAWMIYAGSAVAVFVLALLCLRSRLKMPKLG